MAVALSGRQFLVCTRGGDIAGGTDGFYTDDVRLVSSMLLLVDGREPETLLSEAPHENELLIVQRNLRTSQLAADTVLVERRIVVHDALYTQFTLTNLSPAEISLDLTLDLASDLLNVFQVKEAAYRASGDSTGDAEPLIAAPSAVQPTITLEPQPSGRVWQLRLPARGSWVCELRAGSETPSPGHGLQHARAASADERRQWTSRCPQLRAPELLARPYRQACADLYALRLPTPEGHIPAAGLPWFMTTFGRDSLITSLFSLPIDPQGAIAVLRHLAAHQAVTDDADADAEPGKILHEVRAVRAGTNAGGTYYGSIDSTPLFLVLLREVHRWTQSDALVHELRDAAIAALGWIEHHGDLDGDGYVEYLCRAPHGLGNQSWKDSHDSQRFADGRTAQGEIAPAEVQGYVYAALSGSAELAQTVWGDEQLAAKLRAQARTLRERFNRDFWIADRQCFALALDGAKQPVDSITSNIGHLLWSGIVDDARLEHVRAHLMSAALFSGWGVRTMSAVDGAYNPLSYHNGTVWPHDTALCAAGLLKSGFAPDGAQVALALFEAALHFDGRLPEVFCGTVRTGSVPPVAYPTTCSPQAWAAAAPIFLLRSILGLEIDDKGVLTVASHDVPEWCEGLRWSGVHALGGEWTVAVSERRVQLTQN